MASPGGGDRGGGQAGKGGAPAGGGTSTKATTAKADDCPWKSALHKPPRAIYVMHGYDRTERSTVESALQSFVEHMTQSEKIIESIGANCENAYWNDLLKGAFHEGQRVADMMRCRLMNTALYFANGSVRTEDGSVTNNGGTDEATNKLRCEIVNVFGNILKHRYCPQQRPWKRGIEYAWEIMRQMGDTKWGGMVPPGPVLDQRCTECGYKSKGRKLGIVNGDMATWLLLQWRVMDKITKMERTMECTADWKEYQLEQGQHGNLTAQDEDGKKKLEDVKEEAKKTAEEIVKKMQDEVKEVLDDLGDCTASRATDCVKQLFEKEIRERAAEEAKKKKRDSVRPPAAAAATPAATTPEAPKPPAGGSTEETQKPDRDVARTDKTAGAQDAGGAASGSGQQPQAPASPVLPARPPPPPPPKGKASEGTQGRNDADKAGKCTESSTSTNANASSVSVSLGCTSDKELGVPDRVPPPPPDPAPGQPSAPKTDEDSSNSTPSKSASDPVELSSPENRQSPKVPPEADPVKDSSNLWGIGCATTGAGGRRGSCSPEEPSSGLPARSPGPLTEIMDKAKKSQLNDFDLVLCLPRTNTTTNISNRA
ncbi:hypothetical protein AK88_03852 [Plasmodium fragile]|uniref:Schizont-infected cell agglutination extracellular alpha domain-containing protein n=1 Tax=Plasmodium fragile TaxID=5857 RepID=A0A0D9QL64_PLAFR|nr:uncharacterized protein AK88_03852 [Plasmodium fragile]KJP86476.1 hypothetical protein AK88_03852 [Plasmodium fragile]